MRLVLVSPAWRRFDVTRVALAQRAHLRGVLAGRGVEVSCVVVADDENLDLAREFGFDTIERPNDKLGARFNDGIEYACRDLEADFVVPIGSDDWVHPDAFGRLPAAETGEPRWDAPVVTWGFQPEMVVGRRLAIVDMATGRGRVCWTTSERGAIPWVLPRALLEPCEFRPVPETQQRGIDFAMYAGLRVRPEIVEHDPHPWARVDFKSDVNLNTYEAVTGSIGVGDTLDAWAELACWYPESLVALAHDALAVAA